MSDPTRETAENYIENAISVIHEISGLALVKEYYKEAFDINQKILKNQNVIENNTTLDELL